jgi:hypothetical protein
MKGAQKSPPSFKPVRRNLLYFTVQIIGKQSFARSFRLLPVSLLLRVVREIPTQLRDSLELHPTEEVICAALKK